RCIAPALAHSGSICTRSMSFFSRYGAHRDLHSFPTRRSSDLVERGARGRRHAGGGGGERVPRPYLVDAEVREGRDATYGRHAGGDRKSTRLNSSHQIISYAVFCLKKKTEQRINRRSTPQSGVE